MRITDVRGPNRPTGKTVKKTGDGDFASHLVDGQDDVAETPLTGGIAALDNALFLQETGDALDGRQQNGQHGNRLLSQLDRLRVDLLMGDVSPGRLMQMQRTLEQERPGFVPPEMREVMADIELRVKVELAKYGV